MSELTSASRMNGADRRAEDVGRPHVALDEVEDPLAILDQQRAIDAEFVAQGVDGALVGQRAEDGPADVARQHLPADEDEDTEQEQRDQGQAEPLGEVASHQAAASAFATRLQRHRPPDAAPRKIWLIAVGSTPVTPLLGRGQEVVEVGEQQRRLLKQEALDLAGGGALALQVEGGDVALGQLVVFGVLEVRRVPGAVARQAAPAGTRWARRDGRSR